MLRVWSFYFLLHAACLHIYAREESKPRCGQLGVSRTEEPSPERGAHTPRTTMQPRDVIIACFWFYFFSEKVYGSVIILYIRLHTHTRISRSEWSTRNFSHSTYAIKKLSPTVQVSSSPPRLRRKSREKSILQLVAQLRNKILKADTSRFFYNCTFLGIRILNILKRGTNFFKIMAGLYFVWRMNGTKIITGNCFCIILFYSFIWWWQIYFKNRQFLEGNFFDGYKLSFNFDRKAKYKQGT